MWRPMHICTTGVRLASPTPWHARLTDSSEQRPLIRRMSEVLNISHCCISHLVIRPTHSRRMHGRRASIPLAIFTCLRMTSCAWRSPNPVSCRRLRTTLPNERLNVPLKWHLGHSHLGRFSPFHSAWRWWILCWRRRRCCLRLYRERTPHNLCIMRFSTAGELRRPSNILCATQRP